MIAITRSDEIGCETCFQQMDVFVELRLAARDAAAVMPLMQHHLELCRDCREEYEALLAALTGLG